MAVFERRYLKRNSTGSCSGHICGVYTLEALAEAIATPRIASDGKKDIALKIDKRASVMYLVMCAFTVIFDHIPLINCLNRLV